MSQATTWFGLRFPREVSETQGLAMLLALNGNSTPNRQETFVYEVVGSPEGISHRLRVPEARANGISRQLQTALPGLTVDTLEAAPSLTVLRAWRAWQSNRQRSLSSDQAEVIAHSVLAAISLAEHGEQLALQWILGPVQRPRSVANQVPRNYLGHPVVQVGKAAMAAPDNLDSDAVRALRLKQGLPGWKAVLRIGVVAASLARQRQLLGGLSAAVRMAQGPGVQLGFDGCRPQLLNERRTPWRWRAQINVIELLGLSGLPLGDVGQLPVARVTSRQLPAPRGLGRTGHVLGVSAADDSRPVAISVADGLKHLHLSGATGSGKSTVLLNCIVQDMQAGRSVVLLEPQGDLVRDVLSRVPDNRLDDVVVIDPTSDRPVGLNPLIQPGVPGELVADQLLAVFKGLYADAWGPRTQDLLTAGLLTLVARPGMSLVCLPLLFTDAGFRHRLLSEGPPDPLGTGPFWAWWDGLSPNEQVAAFAAPGNKLRSFLLRARLRRAIGQPEPRFDLREVFTKRRIMLFDLKKGPMGPEASSLLGSLAVSMLWQAALGRTEIEAERRHPVFAYVDEFQDYIHLPQDFSDVLAQARKLGLGVTLSHQNLAQIVSQTLKSAVLANARSRLVFATSHEDASVYIRNDSRLTPEDVVGLPSFEAYASLLSGNQNLPYLSLQTLPPPPATQDPNQVRARSAERWGQPAGEIDAALEALVGVGQRTSSAGSSTSSSSRSGKSSSSELSFGVTTRRKPTGSTGSDEAGGRS